jgi:hypothetical protein
LKPRPIRGHQVDIRHSVDGGEISQFVQRRRCYSSYNVAKRVIEFSAVIPRDQLRPGYGDGFGGAPLLTTKPSQVPLSRGQGGQQCGTSRTEKGQITGGKRDV